MKNTKKVAAWLIAASMALSVLPMIGFAEDITGEPTANYELVNPVAGTGISGELLLSWINPDSDDITAMDIKNSNGESILGDTTLNLSKRAVNSFNVTGLTNGDDYDYTVTYTVAGVEKSEVISGTPQSLDVQWNTQNGFSYDGNWKLAGAGDKARVDTKIYAYVDTTEAHSGKSSMKIVSNFDKTAYARFIDAKGKWGLDSSKTYTLSLWAKVENLGIASNDFHGDRNAIQIITDWDTIGTLGHSGEGWQNYSVQLSGRTWLMPGLFIATQGTVWIDDIELYANDDETKTNLINGGGFEYDCDITREMASVGTTNAVISWKNPAGGTIKGIDILDKNGAKVDTTVSSLVNGEFARASVSGLESGREYTYTIAANMKNGPTLKKDVTFTPGINYQWETQNGIKLHDFMKMKIEQGADVLPFNVEITKEAAHSGKYGLHAVSNYESWVNLKFEGISLDSSKNYRASVWAKATDISHEVWLCSDNAGKVKIDNNGNWKKYSFDISGTGYFIMNLQSAMSAFTDLYADDFAVYELDESGNEIGDNLIKNGDMENFFGAKAGTVTKLDSSVAVNFNAFNYLKDKTLKPTVILAAYHNGKLADVQYEELESLETSQTNEKMLAVAYGDGYDVKAMVWDGNTMIPFGDMTPIE